MTNKKNQTPEKISHFNHEMELTGMEQTNHRLFIAIIVLVILLITTNALWVLGVLL